MASLKELNDKAVADAKAERMRARAAKRAALEAAAAERNRNTGHKLGRGGARVSIPALDGCVFVVSDQHYYPGLAPSPAHRASIFLAKRLKPYAIIANGDAIDGASISRWPAGSFREMGGRPTVAAEIGTAAKHLREYENLKSTRWCIWNLGNHDARFESRLAQVAPEYAGVQGFTLKEHFAGWIPAWATWIGTNDQGLPQVVVKHRFKGGTYGAHNNALWAGVSTVTGHDHMLWAKAITDYSGTRWGIDAGTIADIYNPHFMHYTEDNPVNWQSGFVILHFRDGKFTGPELVHAMPDGRVLFRGDIVAV